MLLEDAYTQVVSYEDVSYYWKKLQFLGRMSHGILLSCALILLQYVSSTDRRWYSKVNINDLRTNVSLL